MVFKFQRMDQESSLLHRISGAACNIKLLLEKADSLQVTLKAEHDVEENRITSTSAKSDEHSLPL